ncbi:hypothetical protein ANT_00130 [Anaerolinea thermophila UNI-1]|uniref:Uncharacterized protein n=1 Tax=Anaerolinea thermophila (strain DSM 14523 / JCM 11388 / NBRC 100420 / UNI-1) TaxID=926569 RepID=E8MYA2_ANATU|nr:hypothetical protein ANT_00130 [Anaerolinea thermophila UNI-1]
MIKGVYVQTKGTLQWYVPARTIRHPLSLLVTTARPETAERRTSA